MSHPKSLGYEFVVDTVLPIIEKYDLDLRDVLHTYCEHAAMQISEVLNQAMLADQMESAYVLVTGGGAFNDFMIDRMDFHSRAEIVLPDREIIEFKEALIFAFLGLLKEQNEVNCLKSVTGARKDHSSGVIYQT
jgi:anhydro-N-acetylmuramic acid kinase